MKRPGLKIAVLSVFVAGGMLLASCGGGGGNGTTADSSKAPETPSECGPDQALPGHKALWTFSQCGEFDYLWLTSASQDTVTGHPLGDLEVSHGKLSIRFTGLHNSKMALRRETFGIYFQATGNDKKEASWRWTSMDLANGKIKSRLAVFRYDLDPNIPEGVDLPYDTEELQFRDETETYQWDCTWNNSRNRMDCTITKPGDPRYVVRVWNITGGRMFKMKFLGVGNNAYVGDYPSYDAVASDFKVTIFD
ncbi:MAG: hypothetical protein OEZ55_14365 [Nitrospinota bacterium]|nr:hypothetical protein [Nitrospinota bacterium]